MEQFDDIGPSVVLASPGMMQSGLSRELFEGWCTDKRNGCIIAGYCVEGTLAKHILSEPNEIVSLGGQKLPLKCSVDYISFSAHADYKQTSEFLRELKPAHVVTQVTAEVQNFGVFFVEIEHEQEAK
ncbi:cleavage and polyadenylation specificity factor subunit 3 [Plakobranchus ocellatus]|uniref:Cleavage and polyadenylation specificity factor subunit 3 n=1 Tax=Plakobranchus ocellatus TaxID=259542 RepID=A0AAV4BNL3_9GAST|nr:cleavage and polyadenylation specificity factor subunit 3 [Plakobranchus ocellatus]